MRTPRKRVFKVTVGGTKTWVEDARGTSIERQHTLAMAQRELGNPFISVRVQEQYLGGAKAKLLKLEEDDDATVGV